MVRRLIGTAVTNSNGEATITYTGTGAGKLNIVAESGTFVSEAYEVLDCSFYDDCSSDAKASSWYKSEGLTVDYPTLYNATRIRNQNADTTSRYYYLNSSSLNSDKIGGIYTVSVPCCIEFDVLSYVGTIGISVTDSTNAQRFPEISSNGHYKIIFNGTTFDFYKDTTKIASYTCGVGYVRFGFVLNAESEGIVIKDFKVYPI